MGSWHASRKVKLILLGLLALLLGLAATAIVPACAPAYTTFAGSVVALVLGYNVSNVVQTHVETKNGPPGEGSLEPGGGDAPVK